MVHQDAGGADAGGSSPAQSPIVQHARRWLFQDLLPFWCHVGFDRNAGAFIEHLSADGAIAPVDFRRVRVQARQIYVYSHAEIQGFSGPGLACAMQALDFLVRHAWLGEQAGWGRTMGANGGLLDATSDLYDNAFVLFALAWLYRATGDPQTKAWIDRTGTAIEHVFADGVYGGYWHAKPARGWREQNPQMHLLEAVLAAFEATADDRWMQRADALVEFAQRKLFDAETGTLTEFYGPDWSRVPGELGARIEPGHQFEWFWLLDWYARLRGCKVPPMAEPLFVFGAAYGIDKVSGLTYDAVSSVGSPIDRSARCWPQCETIKARVVRSRSASDPGIRRAPDLAVQNFLKVFVAPAAPGTWIEHFDADGRPKSARIPSSSVYHIVLALSVYLQYASAETSRADIEKNNS